MFNQKYWGKFHRKEWLIKGDRNTKFFQRSVLACMRRKKVIKIKDDCGLWVDDHRLVAEKFISDYQHRFKSTHQKNRAISHFGLSNIITSEDNEQLIDYQIRTRLNKLYLVSILVKH